ncbi:MAG: shikimate dehydrogenase [Thermomicrobiales bacterium]|jgi:shikimate dehydrogenase|nr:shikimate dehydrogenase [Thermomicrobiales bacterium]
MTDRRFRLGLIGDPVAHSISPAMQQPALDALGIPATFELWHTLADDLPARIASLRESDVLGANVTVPHKPAVMQLIDEVSPLARRAGAVNVIVNHDGRLAGDNTDIHGFAVSLEEACPDARARHALIVGAGGAARAVVLALESIGLSRISLANRNQERAQALAADLSPTPLQVIDTGEQSLATELRRTSILVNATSLGWHRGESPLSPDLLSLLPRNALVVDLTYRDTDLLEVARASGLATLDGLAMLVHQGARALELWTGREAPVPVMMEAARRARAARA